MAEERDFTSGDFHNVAQKQIVHAAYETLAAEKLDWELIAPFLDAARAVCRGDFRENGRIGFHSLRAEGEDWVEAEEAFLGIAIADRESGEEWLAETYWVSDIVTAADDPGQVRRTVAALERSLAKVRSWLAEREAGAQQNGDSQE